MEPSGVAHHAADEECKVYSDLDLYTGVQMIDWTRIFTPNATFAVHFPTA